jgi:hypothetical protein
MPGRLIAVHPPSSGIYRLARGPADPFSPPDWQFALEDGTFGNRFDDPAGRDHARDSAFRTIYRATQRIATFGETIARFRPSLELISQLEAIDDEEPVDQALSGAIDPDDPHRGLIPADWRMRRRVGHTHLDPELSFVDLAHAETMQYLRTALAPFATRLGIGDIDLSSLTSQQRRLTQQCARLIHDMPDEQGEFRFAGIRYPSRLNPDWECWAIFDDRIRHASGWPGFPTSIFPDDKDLMAAAKLFGLTIEVFSGQDHYIRPLPR